MGHRYQRYRNIIVCLLQTASKNVGEMHHEIGLK